MVYNNKYIVYMSRVYPAKNSLSYGQAMLTFTDWPQMATATQYALPNVGGAVPTLIYFTPKKIWVLMFEWGVAPFAYMTSTDPTNPSGWSAQHALYGGRCIDETVICNRTTAYLFFANDNGNIYRASMPIGDFPGAFTNPKTIMTDTKANLFEAVQVYAVKGTNQYLMLVEAMGHAGRYFRSFTATDLAGSWTPLAASESNPFAGKANVTFSTATPGRATSAAAIWFAPIPMKRRPSTHPICSSFTGSGSPRRSYLRPTPLATGGPHAGAIVLPDGAAIVQEKEKFNSYPVAR